MTLRSGYWVGGVGVAVAMLSLAICLEMQMAAARPVLEPAAIDRSVKGDRLPTLPRPSVTPATQPRLPEGCESSVSLIRNPRAREIIGRCLAAAPAADPSLVGPA